MWNICEVVCLLMISTVCFAERELIPLEAPANLSFITFDERDAIIEWNPIDPRSVRGTFKGYLLRVWNHALSQVYAIPPEIYRTSIQFFPFSKNFVTVAVRNDRYVGPRSSAVSFEAPQTEPNTPYFFEHYQLGAKSVLLQWNKPTQPNGIMLGYNIYCSEMRGGMVDEKTTVRYFVTEADNFQAKLTGLKEGTKYWIQLGAVNCAGESDHKTIEVELEPYEPEPPSMPSFKYKVDYNQTNRDEQIKKKCFGGNYQLPPNYREDFDNFYILNGQEKGRIITAGPSEFIQTNCMVNTLVKWIPDVDHNPGEHFYVKYRVKGEAEYQQSAPELEEDYTILEKFNACVNYELILVAVHGEFETESDKQETPAIMFMSHS